MLIRRERAFHQRKHLPLFLCIRLQSKQIPDITAVPLRLSFVPWYVIHFRKTSTSLTCLNDPVARRAGRHQRGHRSRHCGRRRRRRGGGGVMRGRPRPQPLDARLGRRGRRGRLGPAAAAEGVRGVLQDHPVVLVVPGQRPRGRVALLALLGAHGDAGEGRRGRRSAGGPGGGRPLLGVLEVILDLFHFSGRIAAGEHDAPAHQNCTRILRD